MTTEEEFEMWWAAAEFLPADGESWAHCAARDAYLAAAQRTAQRCVEICDSGLVNRNDDPLANFFDGGLRYCASRIREQFLP